MSVRVEGVCSLLQVFDMQQSLRFYRDILGFEVVQQSEPGEEFDWCLLRLGPAELMLNTAYERDARPALPDPARVAAHDDTALYFGCHDIDGTYRYLLSKAVDARAPFVTSYGMKQLYLHDPDGYCVCFQRSATKADR